MMNNPVILPAEWENECAVILSWPHKATDWNYMLSQAEECYDAMTRAIARHAPVVMISPDTAPLRERFSDLPPGRIIYADVPTNDTWVRDYGPITVLDPDGNPIVNDFGFNAWGGKFAFALDNKVTSRLAEMKLITAPVISRKNFILEGGSIESDGNGTLLTTTSCLLTDTRNSRMTKGDIEMYLKEALGVRKILWLEKGAMIGDDTDGHIDTIARLAPYNTILYNGTGWGTDDGEQSVALAGILDELKEMTTADGEHFNLVELPLPDAVLDEDDGHRLPATYANFLIVNDAVIMPVYNQPMNDMRAEMALRVAFPDHKIERVDCTALIRQHGSLHCATIQIPVSAVMI